MSGKLITPKDPGYQQFGRPECGNVRLLPASATEESPWCIHHDGSYVWRAEYPEKMTPPWTKMVRIMVTSQPQPEQAWTMPPEHERSGYMKDALEQTTDYLLSNVLDDLVLIGENSMGAADLVARSIDRLVVVKNRHV